MNPLFSFIIPVYNSEKTIEKCVDSVLNQRCENYEVILIDDGSKDHSGSICDEYAINYSNVRVIHKKNDGVSMARKDGIEIAKGDYIVCVDSDDWIEEKLLEDARKVIVQHRPEIIIYGCLIEDLRGNITEINLYDKGCYSREKLERDIFPKLIQNENGCYFHSSLWGAIFEKSILDDNLLADSRATIGEDQASVIPTVAKAQSMYVMDGIYYHYVYNRASATKRRKPFEWNYPRIVNEHIMEKIDLNMFDFEEQLYRKICHDFWNVSFSQFYGDKRYKEVKSEILKNINDDFYKNAIENARFKGSKKASFMMMTLRHKYIFLMYLYAKVRKY